MRRIQFTLFSLLAASNAAFADMALNLTPGVSPISHDVYSLHMTVFWICVAIGIVVFGVMIYSMIYHRKSLGAKPAEFHTHPVLEITWTIIPVIILVLMAIPATKVLLNMNNTDKEELTVKITGYQWKWHYEYLEDDVKFFSNLSTTFDQIHNKAPKTADYLREVDNPMVVPIHKKIRLLITSNDVNHAWWVADLGVKRDALGGFINEAWTIIDKPGIYRGQCAELCGVNHAFMPIVVVATTEQGYKDWVAKQKGQATSGEAETNKAWTMDELMQRGEQVYSRICAACHQPGGVGSPPTFPALKGSKITIGPAAKHVDVVMNGVSGTAMQAFKNQLSDVELAAVITYERNAFGNNTGSIIQPIQMKAYRDGKSLVDALAVKPGAAPVTPAKQMTQAEEKAKPSAVAIPPSSLEEAQAENQAKQPTVAASDAAKATASSKLAEAKQKEDKAANVSPTTSKDKEAANAALSDEDYLKQSMSRGEKVYLGTCVACHQVAGTGLPPTFPALKDSPIATGPVAAHIDRVLNGKPGTSMLPFKDQLKDQELADVINYERHSWGNNAGPALKAEDIQAARTQGQKP